MGNISKSCKNLCGFDQAQGTFTAANEPLLGETYTGPLPSVVSKQKKVCEVYRQLGFSDVWLTKIQPLRIARKKALYYGETDRGQPFGHARVLFDDGSLFEGEFIKPEVNCKDGLFIYRDGSYYRGGISQNRANGNGHISYRTDLSLTYDGDWLNDLPHGHGKQKTKDGWQYVGYFHHGVKQGNGRLQWPNGDYYSGKFHEGFIQGQGQLVSQVDGYRYRGQWRKNLREGKGEEIYASGQIYEGNFKRDLRNGRGEWTDAEGTKTSVEYKDGVEV